MTHFVFHPQQKPFASPPSRQRKMRCFCHRVSRSLLLSPAEVDDSGNRGGCHSPRASIPRGTSGQMAKLGFAVAEVGRTLSFFLFFTAHTPLLATQGSDASLRSRFSTLLPACSSASHMYTATRKACMQNAEGLHHCHDPLDMTERRLRLNQARLAIMPYHPISPRDEGRDKRQKCVIPHIRIPGFWPSRL